MSDNINDNIFGERLRRLLEENDIEGKSFAEYLHVQPPTLSNWLNGNRFPKEREILIKIADYFNVSTDYLLGKTIFKNYEDEDMRDIEYLIDSIINNKNEQVKQLGWDLLEIFQLTTTRSISAGRLEEATFIKNFYDLIYTLQNTLTNNAFTKRLQPDSSDILTDEQIKELITEVKAKFNLYIEQFIRYSTDDIKWGKDFDFRNLDNVIEDRFSFKDTLNRDEVLTMAAHKIGHEGSLNDSELADIELAIKVALTRNEKK